MDVEITHNDYLVIVNNYYRHKDKIIAVISIKSWWFKVKSKVLFGSFIRRARYSRVKCSQKYLFKGY